MGEEPKTLHAWKQTHPHVNVLAFESNHDKSCGFGDLEEVCGFCLASHYFEDEPPELCAFCRTPIREGRAISDLPEIVSRKYRLAPSAPTAVGKPDLLIVSRREANQNKGATKVRVRRIRQPFLLK